MLNGGQWNPKDSSRPQLVDNRRIWTAYTDGSANAAGTRAGWSYILTGHTPRCGPVVLNPTLKAWRGTRRANAVGAEHNAMLELLMAVDDQLEEEVGELHIYTDATHTIKVTKGHENCTQEPQLARQLQKRYQDLQKIIKVTIFRVNGHTGDVGNEIVNEYAGRAQQGKYLHLPEDYLYSPVHELHIPMNAKAPHQEQHLVWQIIRAQRLCTTEQQRHQCANDMGEVLANCTLPPSVVVSEVVNQLKNPNTCGRHRNARGFAKLLLRLKGPWESQLTHRLKTTAYHMSQSQPRCG